jgi:hypothetical protein
VLLLNTITKGLELKLYLAKLKTKIIAKKKIKPLNLIILINSILFNTLLY